MSDIFWVELEIAMSTATEPQGFVLFLTEFMKLFPVGIINNFIGCSLQEFDASTMIS